jgi:hypothetical protein
MIKKEVFKQFPNLKPIIKKLAFQTQENFFEQKLIKEKEMSLTPKLHPQSPKYKILKQEAERLFNDVEDMELKETMISIFIQSK